jgi:hypothetical protein
MALRYENQSPLDVSGVDRPRITAVESSLTDDELLECESCLRAYEVKRGPDGLERLVARPLPRSSRAVPR